MALTLSQTNDVLAVLDQYACAYQERNREKILSLVSAGISGFGSGPDEVVINPAQFRHQITRDLMQADSVSLSLCILKIDGQMPFAWVTAFCGFQVTVRGETMFLDGRMTALFRNTGSRWLFEQIHFSLPNEDQESGESYPGSA
jgi:hypothetical protein